MTRPFSDPLARLAARLDVDGLPEPFLLEQTRYRTIIGVRDVRIQDPVPAAHATLLDAIIDAAGPDGIDQEAVDVDAYLAAQAHAQRNQVLADGIRDARQRAEQRLGAAAAQHLPGIITALKKAHAAAVRQLFDSVGHERETGPLSTDEALRLGGLARRVALAQLEIAEQIDRLRQQVLDLSRHAGDKPSEHHYLATLRSPAMATARANRGIAEPNRTPWGPLGDPVIYLGIARDDSLKPSDVQALTHPECDAYAERLAAEGVELNRTRELKLA